MLRRSSIWPGFTKAASCNLRTVLLLLPLLRGPVRFRLALHVAMQIGLSHLAASFDEPGVQSLRILGLLRVFPADCLHRYVVTTSGSSGYSGFPAYGQVY